MCPRITLDTSFGYTLFLILLIHLFSYGYTHNIPNGNNIGFKMKLIPRQDIDSGLFPKKLSLLETHERLVQLSRARAYSFRSITNATATPQTLQPRVINVLTSLYVVQMMIGTEPYSTFMLMDSGSDDMWLQCDGCVNCFPLGGGGYKYHKSTTYKAVSCDHPLCIPKMCSPTRMCLYDIRYSGGAISRGIVSADNFTFPDNEGFVSFQDVLFGCGFDNRNIMFGGPLGDHNFISGIIGLGAGPRSILSQLSSVTNLRYSYCFTPYSSQAPISYLWFGDDAKITGDYKTTPLNEQGLPRYYVTLSGIAVDGADLPIDPIVFAFKPDKTGGFAFDTGAGQTFLIKSAYDVLRSHVTVYFEQYNMHPITGRKVPYDLCYDLPPAGTDYSRSSMTYHFDGADLMVDSSQVFQDFDDKFCLIVLPQGDDEGPTILGAYQMVNYRFLFDVQQTTVSFGPEMCSGR